MFRLLCHTVGRLSAGKDWTNTSKHACWVRSDMGYTCVYMHVQAQKETVMLPPNWKKVVDEKTWACTCTFRLYMYMHTGTHMYAFWHCLVSYVCTCNFTSFDTHLEIISTSGTPKLMKFHGTFLLGVSALLYCLLHTAYHLSFPTARTVTEKKTVNVHVRARFISVYAWARIKIELIEPVFCCLISLCTFCQIPPC